MAPIGIDASGIKWFATVGGGAARFDGTYWTVYSTSTSDIASDAVVSIAVGNNEDKWFGTYDAGISVLRECASPTPIGTNTPSHISTATPTHTATYAATASVTDTPTPTSTPTNAPPVVGTITATARFTDVNVSDAHTSVWTWGDVSNSAGLISEAAGSGTVTGTHVYTTPGIYTIQLTVTDNHGASGTAPPFMYVVVYDPAGGFVTVSGRFTSPPGAYRPNQTVTGRVNLGFVAKYRQNGLEGDTQFNFSAANFTFDSVQYQWLVVSGARAQFKGTGTVNGTGNYGFIVTLIDGDLVGPHEPDRFRIKVWDQSNGNAVVYDNQYGEPDAADPVTALEQGSINIHR